MKILGATDVARSKSNAEGAQVLVFGATVQNLLARANYCPQICTPDNTIF